MSNSLDKSFTFTWKIENFNYSLISNGKRFESPRFTSSFLNSTSWYLYITDKNKEHLSYQLIKIDSGISEMRIKFTLQLITDEGEVLLTRSTTDIRVFSKEKKKSGWEKFCEMKKFKKVIKCLMGSTLTLRCTIIPCDLPDLIYECKAWTKVSSDRKSFCWSVDEINSSSWKACRVFPCCEAIQIEISLTTSDDLVKICVKKVQKEKSASYYVICKLSLLDLNDVEKESKTSEYQFKSEDENDTWEFPNFLQKSKFQTEKSKYIKDGKFTLMCDFFVSNGNTFGYIEEYGNNDLVNIHYTDKTNTLTDLQKDLSTMYENKLKTDIDLRVKSRTFPAHKSILSARSSVFASMLEQNMVENQTIDMNDVDVKIMGPFLEFIYTGIVGNLNYELASKLLIVADKYKIYSLKNKCCSFLMLNISNANVLKIVVLSHVVKDNILKAYAVDYILKHVAEILISDLWSMFVENNMKLATDIVHKLSINLRTKIYSK